MIDVHYWPTPNGWKVTIMLEECNLAYAVKPVDIGGGDQFSADFLRISPNNPDHIYAATRFGVWRSLDAGQNWSPVLANPRYHTPAGVPQSIVGTDDRIVTPQPARDFAKLIDLQRNDDDDGDSSSSLRRTLSHDEFVLVESRYGARNRHGSAAASAVVPRCLNCPTCFPPKS